ncbi:MAG: multicopper oxidase domain-containing protein [Flavobacteriales bacterium]|nr:multicopper oxidase domain-containing protein [Flavobacteriales bacterium]
MMKILLSVLFTCGTVFLYAQTNVFLIGRTLGEKIIANGDTMRVFGFAPNLSSHPPIPAPLIEANQGDSVHIDFWNVSQLHHHTIHLHGLDVNQANDGVPMLSFDVDHMEHGWYHFKAPHAGTYLYHCHVGSTLHLQAGMYGPVIIRPSDGSNTTWDGGYAFDTETLLFMSEFDTFWHSDSILDHEHDNSAVHDSLEIPRYTPDFFAINGLSDQQLEDTVELTSKTNYVNYFRLVNIGYCSNKVIFPGSLNAIVVDSDGRPLPNNVISDTVEIYPGERYGVLAESGTPVLDSIEVHYFDMMTGVLKDVQYVKVDIQIPNQVAELPNLNNLRLAPNPTELELKVTFDLIQPATIGFRVVSIDGRLIKSELVKRCPNGNQSISINTSNYSAGQYIISITDGTRVVSKQFVKK